VVLSLTVTTPSAVKKRLLSSVKRKPHVARPNIWYAQGARTALGATDFATLHSGIDMAEIVLVNPRFEVSYWGLEHALPLLHKRANLPTACLPLLAALTPAEHTVTINR